MEGKFGMGIVSADSMGKFGMGMVSAVSVAGEGGDSALEATDEHRLW